MELTDDHQLSALLATPATDIHALCRFFQRQIDAEAYLFARKELALKQRWPVEYDAALGIVVERATGKNELANAARELEVCLIQYEVRVQPDQLLQRCLARAYKSEADLFKT